MEKVSVITPVYNGESYIARFLDSVLIQTYSNIELIVIDDGSTDRTREIVSSYKKYFCEKNMDLIYIYQENAGAAAAINKGLEVYSGDYLTWPDSDDFLAENSIEAKVNYLKKTSLSIVRSNGFIVNDSNVHKILRKKNIRKRNKIIGNIFDNYVLETISFSNGGFYLITTSAFKESNPKQRIYESSAGQNWQMLLPVLYKYECGYIDETLCTYVVRENSHSRQEKSYEELKSKLYKHEDILVKTINSLEISEEEKEKYLKLVKLKYIKRNYALAKKFKKFEEVTYYYKELMEIEKKLRYKLSYLIQRVI